MSTIGQGRYLFAEFQLDATQRLFVREGENVPLQAQTFDLLHYFVANAQRVISKDELMRAVWPDEAIDESVLNQHIFQLRRALTASEPGYRLLAAVPGTGFQFTQPVTEIASGPGASPRLVLHSAASQTVKSPLATGPARREGAAAAAPTERRAGPEPEPNDLDVPVTPVYRTARFEEMEAESAPVAETAPAAEAEAAPISSRSGRDEKPAGRERKPRKRPAARKRAVAIDPEEDERSPLARAFTLPRLLMALGGLIVVAGAIWLGWRNLREPHYDGITLLLTETENAAADAEFDGGLTAAIAMDMGQSPKVALVPRATVAATLQAMQRPAVTAITPDLAKELCGRIHPQAWLASSISRVSTRLLISMDAYDCGTGLRLAQTRGLADTNAAVLPLLDRMAADLRMQLGEPASSVERVSRALPTTVTLAALKAYAQGTGPGFAAHPGNAEPILQQAVGSSPQFAQGWAELAIAQYAAGEREPAAQSLRRAWELRNTVDEASRLAITALYLSRITGDTAAAGANYRAWTAQYPRNPQPFAELADLDIQIGHADQAVEPARRAVTLDPANPGVYTLLARAQMRAGSLDDALATAKLAVSRHTDEAALHEILFQLAYLRHDSETQEEQRKWARDHQAGPQMDLEQAMLLLSQGSVKQALEMYETVLADYRHQGMTEAASRIEAGLPRWQAELGQTEPAYVRLQKQPEGSSSVDLPVAWAEVGETSRAAALLAKDVESYAGWTVWQQDYAPQVRAAIAMAQQKPAVAIDELKAAAAWDMRGYEVPAMRGRAYLAAKEPVLAEYEFLKILDHPGIEPLSPNYPLAQLGLARALAMQGKNLKAAQEYRTFLDEWTLADADLPRLREARAEMARLPKADVVGGREP